MSTAPTPPEKTEAAPDEIKSLSDRNLSKFEYDLYHEEDDIQLPVIRVKCIDLPNNGCKWKIFENNKVTFTFESTKLSKAQVKYLQTIEGFNFILSQAKIGITSITRLTAQLRSILKNKKSKHT